MPTPIEHETLGISWFFTNGKEIAFAASAGGKLPVSIGKMSLDTINSLVDYFMKLPSIGKAIINPDIKDNVESLQDWIQMAEKGLFAFDKRIPGNFADSDYSLIARPSVFLKLENLPSQICQVLNESKIKGGDIPEIFTIDDIS